VITEPANDLTAVARVKFIFHLRPPDGTGREQEEEEGVSLGHGGDAKGG
jgi:hypothetical protein